MLVSPSTMFHYCYGSYAIAAVNIWCLEQVYALFRAGEKSNAPFILQMTPVAIRYGGLKVLLAMINAVALDYPGAVYSIHLDHGSREAALESISSGGFSSVMIDASHESFKKNIAITRTVVEKAHAAGMEVEAELGVLSGVEDHMEVDAGDSRFTRPDEVVDFVSRTGCDSLAIAIGTSHGAYKFKGDQSLQFHILEEIQKKLPGFPLVLHGGSAVDSREVKRINASGGKLEAGASGVPAGDIKKAISNGICKANIATDARIVWTRVHRAYFQEHHEKFDPLPPGRIYMNELEILYREKFRMLGAINKAKEHDKQG